MRTLESFLNGVGQTQYKKAKNLIPGGTQLLSKRPEMFAPDVWPAYFSKAKGCHVWDLDKHKYLDMSIMGIGASILGYADEDVDNAVIDGIKNGVCSSLNCHEEVELAELLMSLHPWAEMARFPRSGGEAMAVAVRIARAATKRDCVLFSGYHGWSDWYLAANLGDADSLDGQLMPGLEPNGVPRGLKGSALPFHFNDINELRKLGKGKEVAAIVVEPARGEEATEGFLQSLRAYADEIGAVLIFDEITSGFRLNPGGIHLRYNVNPDMAVFAKSMANGYAMAAVIGKGKYMQAAQTTFISSTNWTERIGPVAAIATIKKYMRENVADHIIKIGSDVQKMWKDKAQKHGLDIAVSGLPTLANFAFKGEHSRTLATYFTVEMLRRDILGFRQFKASYAHKFADLSGYTTAVDDVFAQIAKADPNELLQSPVMHAGFARLTKE